jgi:hypothetical protein
VSNCEQPAIPFLCRFTGMKVEIKLKTVELDGNDGLVATFSDGTTGAYVVEELLEMRPFRERTKIKKIRMFLSQGCNDDDPEAKARQADC